jgi:serine/threonine protein kinase/Tol biopolymer transport system component
MTPERYHRINDLADAAMELSTDRRTAYLASACAGDLALQQAVEQLIQAHDSHNDFLAAPAAALLAAEFAGSSRSEDEPGKQESVRAGRSVGRYRLISRLGGGGHGDVWLALDPQLSRDVAVKLLSPEYASHPAHVQRLYTEARMSSALNHPNIVTIYDTGHAEGADFIAQEYVSGETLRKALAKGPLGLRQALNLALQIASALEAAHSAGVVHGDIKPENIMIRDDGTAKVLDFGLARFVDEARNDWHVAARSGVVMGTVKYLSPEQVRGGPIDSRSDVFSFGILLYEIVSGKHPFQGKTYTEIMSAIVQSDPEAVSKLVPTLPSQLDRIVGRCLSKLPGERYPSAMELRRDLEQFITQLDSRDPARSRVLRLAATTAAVVLLAAVAIYVSVSKNAPAPFEHMSLSLLPTPGVVPDAAFSADARTIAYSLRESRGQSLWLRTLGSGDDRRLLDAAPESYRNLTFSPDGRYLYYVTGPVWWSGTLYRLSVTGGPPERVLEHLTGNFAFARDGRRFAFIRLDAEHWRETLMVVNADGSGERKIVTRDRPQYYSREGLAWSPDGRSIVCLGGNALFYKAGAFRLVEIRLEDGTERPITDGGWAFAGSVMWSADGRTIYVGAGENGGGALQVWRVSYPGGRIQRITNDLSNYVRLTQASDSRILAVRREQDADFWVMPDRDTARAEQISFGDLHNLNSAAWASGSRIFYSSLAGNSRNIWTMDSHGRNRRQLTSDDVDRYEVAATHDGRYVLYTTAGCIWRINSDGSGAKQLTRGPHDVHPAVTPDGKWVVYVSFSGWSPGIGGTPILWKISINGGPPVQITTGSNSLPDISPDGKYIACLDFQYSTPDVASRIAVFPLDGGSALTFFNPSRGTDGHAYWTADGKALEYIVTSRGVGNIWRQTLDGEAPRQVTTFNNSLMFFMAPSPDGRSVLMARGKEVNDLVLIIDVR